MEDSFFQTIELKERWQRFERDGHRFYHNGKKVLAGITTILNAVMPTPKALSDWMADNSLEELQRTADFGSMLHLLILFFMKKEEWYNSIVPNDKNRVALWKGVIAFRNFEQDYFAEIAPFLLEMPVHGKVAGCEFVTTVDFFAPMAIKVVKEVEGEEEWKSGVKKGQKKMVKVEETKTIKAIVDFKSNYYDKDKDFYQPQLFQLLAQKAAIEQQSGLKVDKIFNWTTTGFREDNGANTYKLVEWVLEGAEKPKDCWKYKTYTKSDVKQFELYMRLAKERGLNVPQGTITTYLPFLRGDDKPSHKKQTYQEFILKR